MKFIYLFFILLLASCGSVKKTYVCGENDCLDKKEYKDFFDENLSVEIKIISKKKKKVDLVQLNTKKNYDQTDKETNTQFGKSDKKAKKLRLKAQKSKLKEERRKKKIEEKYRIKEEKKLVKLKKKKIKIQKNKITNKELQINEVTLNQTKISKSINKEPQTSEVMPNQPKISKSIKSTKKISICAEIKDCDIEKITDVLIKNGNKKDFPNITLK